MTFSRSEIASLQQQLEQQYPQDILRWAAETFASRLAVVTSFQPTGIVTLHMLSQIAPQTAVITLDTGQLFPETLALMDDLEVRLNLHLTRVRPRLTIAQQAARCGDALWERDPDRCCQMRKVTPLRLALRGYDAWLTGLRRDQSSQRATTPIVAIEQRYSKIRVAPLATWTERMIWDYIHAHDLPYNPLHDQGYTSIGCQPCTQPSPDGSLRGGRWVRHHKLECGIHQSGRT